jgi:hypothetical protein
VSGSLHRHTGGQAPVNCDQSDSLSSGVFEARLGVSASCKLPGSLEEGVVDEAASYLSG